MPSHKFYMDVPIEVIRSNVAAALEEDLGTGDLHKDLILDDSPVRGTIITRSSGILCGTAWVNEVYRQVSEEVSVEWIHEDGAALNPNDQLASISGPPSALLAAERNALNFLQLLSGTATRTREFVQLIAHTKAKILDSRKTIPGLRLAQKYAVSVGGGTNHRIGLFDAILIKENHIAACGGIQSAVYRAREVHPGVFVEVEVENTDELVQAIRSKADRIMLDNFKVLQLREAVRLARSYSTFADEAIELEASGGIDRSNVVQVAETGVDCISLGTLTNDVESLDFSFGMSR
ncbi:MAG: carboxylating nicotinate-nucleotide diphosphorylase [Gammaproteobacteria bacterium]|nr:carboxylating nicotinate-nucleotide diphosphorylase [Gammaproteobacteria bacterium]